MGSIVTAAMFGFNSLAQSQTVKDAARSFGAQVLPGAKALMSDALKGAHQSLDKRLQPGDQPPRMNQAGSGTRHRLMQMVRDSGVAKKALDGALEGGLHLISELGKPRAEAAHAEGEAGHAAASHEEGRVPTPPPRRQSAANHAGLPAESGETAQAQTAHRPVRTQHAGHADGADEAEQLELEQAQAQADEQAALDMQLQEQADAGGHDHAHHHAGHGGGGGSDPVHSSGVSASDQAALKATGQQEEHEKFQQQESDMALRGMQNKLNMGRLKRSDAHQHDLGRVGM